MSSTCKLCGEVACIWEEAPLPTILRRQSDGGGGGGPPRRSPQRRGGRPVHVGRLLLLYVVAALVLLGLFWGLTQLGG